jgi:DNA replication protein DnaC
MIDTISALGTNEFIKDGMVEIVEYCPSCKKEKGLGQYTYKKERNPVWCEECKTKERIKAFKNMIPNRYEGVSFTAKEIDEYIPTCTILYGGFGTGKTWRAYETAFQLYKKGWVSGFQHITEIGIINEIKAGFVDNSFDIRVKKFKEIDLLIVDEMGKNNDSDFNKAQIFEILNYRYDWEKKTILICNCEDKKELYDILSPAILDRFRERIVKMDGKSKRYTDV